jgi:hypothetical protein
MTKEGEEPQPLPTTKVTFAILEFAHIHESIAFYHANNKDLKLLNPNQIASLILTGAGVLTSQLTSSPSKVQEKSEKLPLDISKDVTEVVLEKVVLDQLSFKTLTGLSQLENSAASSESFASKLGSLKEAIEKNDGQVSQVEHSVNEAVEGIHYLPASDKLLLHTASELKLLSRSANG